MKFLPTFTAALLFMVGTMAMPAIPEDPEEPFCLPLSQEDCRVAEGYEHELPYPKKTTFCGYCPDIEGKVVRGKHAAHNAFVINDIGLCCGLGETIYCAGKLNPKNCPVRDVPTQ